MLLKVGSRGPEVKSLQEFLGIGADGIFGKGTEFAVKEFQKLNGLTVDGLVGPGTWDCMGLDTFYRQVNIKVESQKKNIVSYTIQQDGKTHIEL